MTKPKVILFDIGGVCVVSPMSAIVDYETKHGIPKDYINFAISRSAPNGAWQRLERGDIKMDDHFFDEFRRDINNPDFWAQYHLYFKNRRGGGGKSSLKELARANATQLGDPVSLKAETSATNPTPDEGGAPRRKRRSFRDAANKSMLGDPISLKTEKSKSGPLPDDSGAPPSAGGSGGSDGDQIPPQPQIDSTTLFWDMMARSRTPDPHMWPAVAALRASGQYIVAALSNTVIFPEGHEYATDSRNLHGAFDLFVSSAHVGVRKPDPEIYRLTLEKLDRLDRDRGGSGVGADQITFLDDIGANLKAAAQAGFATIKVNLGRVDEAVRELERVTGLELAGGQKSKL